MAASTKQGFSAISRNEFFKNSYLLLSILFLMVLLIFMISIREPKNTNTNITENNDYTVHEIQISRNGDFATIQDTEFWEAMARNTN